MGSKVMIWITDTLHYSRWAARAAGRRRRKRSRRGVCTSGEWAARPRTRHRRRSGTVGRQMSVRDRSETAGRRRQRWSRPARGSRCHRRSGSAALRESSSAFRTGWRHVTSRTWRTCPSRTLRVLRVFCTSAATPCCAPPFPSIRLLSSFIYMIKLYSFTYNY